MSQKYPTEKVHTKQEIIAGSFKTIMPDRLKEEDKRQRRVEKTIRWGGEEVVGSTLTKGKREEIFGDKYKSFMQLIYLVCEIARQEFGFICGKCKYFFRQ